jgi:peroxin-1
MVETKKMLLETLKWPTMYPQIFDKCPLRLRSGILLYGYPGCGKTMLANAVAKECGLNFISVKGPELLNKYIGASEKAVRDLFERARGCKPCCLFFDEFDSVAPQRGHDNSGVTDRVVNQLLTEMDGAEGLDGVYVLAATSRPEMIDPALLRPGRLDKAIFCDIPNYEERLDIIRTVKETIVLSPEINVGIIATKTQGCSGADIQSLLYAAHLSAINERIATQSLNESVETSSHPFAVVQGDVDRAIVQDELNVIVGRKQNTNKKYIKEKIIVTEKHMNSALSNCRPSLRNEEFLKLKHSYLKFQGVEQPKKEVGIRALYG